MAVQNVNQITKCNNKTKLLEFNDKLQHNDFSEKTGVQKSTTHSKFSRIELVIVDWTKGKGSSATVVNYKLHPTKIKALCELIVSGNTGVFEATDSFTKQKGYFEQKINHYEKNEKGLSPVSKVNIRFDIQLSMGPSFVVTIENGVGKVAKSQIGGISIQSGTYQKLSSSSVYISKTEMVFKAMEIRDHIQNFELINTPKMYEGRRNFIQSLKNDNTQSA